MYFTVFFLFRQQFFNIFLCEIYAIRIFTALFFRQVHKILYKNAQNRRKTGKIKHSGLF